MADSRGLKLPEYNTNINDWLLHVDAFLSQQDDVTDKQKYGALIGALPTPVIVGVQEILVSPPETNKYEALRSALKKRYCRNNDETTYQKIITITLGSLLPSELLEEMKRLNATRDAPLPDSVIRSMHLAKLPTEIQTLVDAVGANLPDIEYGLLADKTFKRQTAAQTDIYAATVNNNQQPAVDSAQTAQIEILSNAVSELKNLVQTHLSKDDRQPEVYERLDQPRGGFGCRGRRNGRPYGRNQN